MENGNGEKWLNVEEVADMLDVTPTAVFELGGLEAREEDGTQVFSRTSVFRWRAENGADAKTRAAKPKARKKLKIDVEASEVTSVEPEAIACDPPLKPLVPVERKLRAIVEAVECGVMDRSAGWDAIVEAVK